MTKKDLIKLLESIPDDALIVIDGHSDGTGYCNINAIDPVSVIDWIGDWEGDYMSYNQVQYWVDNKKIPFTVYRVC